MRVRGAGPMMAAALVIALGGAVAACDGSKPLIQQHDDSDDDKVGPFPAADRPVADVVSSRWSSEDARDRLREAD